MSYHPYPVKGTRVLSSLRFVVNNIIGAWCVHRDSVLFVERANELVLYGLYKELCSGYIVKASVNSANISYGLDPKPGELHMGRVNAG